MVAGVEQSPDLDARSQFTTFYLWLTIATALLLILLLYWAKWFTLPRRCSLNTLVDHVTFPSSWDKVKKWWTFWLCLFSLFFFFFFTHWFESPLLWEKWKIMLWIQGSRWTMENHTWLRPPTRISEYRICFDSKDVQQVTPSYPVCEKLQRLNPLLNRKQTHL